MHALALEQLKDYIKEGSKVLDIGFGSSYLVTAFSKMMNDKGTVVGVEHIPELYELGKKNIEKHNKHLIDNKHIILSVSDGRLGYSKNGPYNAIHVGAAAPEIPKSLVEQLCNGGRMFIPVGKPNSSQSIILVDKDNQGKITTKEFIAVSYVPLTSVDNQLNK